MDKIENKEGLSYFVLDVENFQENSVALLSLSYKREFNYIKAPKL